MAKRKREGKRSVRAALRKIETKRKREQKRSVRTAFRTIEVLGEDPRKQRLIEAIDKLVHSSTYKELSAREKLEAVTEYTQALAEWADADSTSA
jgi:hypothetical protein